MKASELRDKLNELIKEKGDCVCFLHENCNHCEADHFIDGFIIKSF